VNHPEYRAWKLAILEDLYSSYTFHGLLWGVERWGPLHQVLSGETPCCFCEHCGRLAREAGLDWRAVTAGYAAFRDAVRRNRAGQTPGENLLRLFLAYPAIIGWEARWTQTYLTLHRELYGAAKWMQPERAFGLGLWHYYFIDPLLQAEWNLAEFSATSDYIRPILYHLPEGPRIKRHLGNLTSAFATLSEETLWAFISELVCLQLPPLEHFATVGLPAAYVTQGIETVRRNSRPGTTIYAGLGLDVFEQGLARSMTPEDAEAAVYAAHAAKANGITISRNYAEMQHGNLEAIGRAVRALASSCANGLASQSAQGRA
jgi:hypothetical protein